MRRTRAFTLIELLVVISIIALLIGILLPALGAARRTANQMKNSTQLRGIHQSSVVFAQSNNFYLQGLDFNGGIIASANGAGPWASPSDAGGDTPAARLYILCNGSFISGAICINPTDTLTKWTSNAMHVSNYSYSMVRITSTSAPGDTGRLSEWKDNANSQAVLISDRAIDNGTAGDIGSPQIADGVTTGVANSNIKSPWTTQANDWKGNMVWGDNHAEFSQTWYQSTRFSAQAATFDSLFFDETTGSGGYTIVAGSNAFMVYY